MCALMRLADLLRGHAALLAVAAVAGLAGMSASAQSSAVLHQRVRVTTAPYSGFEVRHVGVVTSLEADTLRLVGDGMARAIPFEAIRRLELSRGRRGRPLIGALVGAGMGVAIGVSTVGRDDAGVGVVVVPLSMGLYGGLGALIGMAFRTERWETVPAEPLRRP